MLPAGLVWGRGAGATAVDGSAMLAAAAAGAYGVATPGTGAQPLVYCYNPAPAGAPDVQLPASLTYPHQLQQQQMLLAATKAHQQMYVQTGLGLQPYQLQPAAAAASSLPGAANTAALQLHAPLTLTPGGNLPYISSDTQLYHLPSTPSPAAGVAPTSIALTQARKVRRCCCSNAIIIA